MIDLALVINHRQGRSLDLKHVHGLVLDRSKFGYESSLVK